MGDFLDNANHRAFTLGRMQMKGEYPDLGLEARAAMETLIPIIEQLQKDQARLKQRIDMLELEHWKRRE